MVTGWFLLHGVPVATVPRLELCFQFHALSCPSDLRLRVVKPESHLLRIRGFLLSCVVVETSQLLRLALVGAHWLRIGLCLLR